MQTYALVVITTLLVDNIIEWDGNTDAWLPPDGMWAILPEPTDSFGIGYSYNPTTKAFTPPVVATP